MRTAHDRDARQFTTGSRVLPAAKRPDGPVFTRAGEGAGGPRGAKILASDEDVAYAATVKTWRRCEDPVPGGARFNVAQTR